MKLYRYSIPTIITLLRLIAAPLFYFSFLHYSIFISFAVFLFAALTDVIDGIIARKLSATSAIGAYLDVVVDFLFIAMAFAALMQKNWYCICIFIPIIVSFVVFFIGSGIEYPIYDPIGKYFGSFCMAMILITLLFPTETIRKILTYALAVFFMLSLISRTYSFRKEFAARKMARFQSHDDHGGLQ
jgi:CDP-diacylglycerol--glycerol-3-phosphate 3-phosphatidyltransferase